MPRSIQVNPSQPSQPQNALTLAKVRGRTLLDIVLRRLSPDLLLGVLVVGMLLLALWLARHEAQLLRNDMLRDISVVETQIRARLEADQEFLDQLGREKLEGVLSGEQFDLRVSRRATESPHFARVIWEDAEGLLRWYAPANRTLDEVKRERAPLAEQERLRRLSHATNRSTYSVPYLDGNQQGFVELAMPIEGEGVPRVDLGTYLMVYPLNNLLEKLLPEWFNRKYRAALEDSEGRLLTRQGTTEPLLSLSQSLPLTLPWTGLRLRVTATPTSSTLTGLLLPAMLAALSGLIGWSLYALHRQAEARRAGEQALVRTNIGFETVLDALDSAVYVVDSATDTLRYQNAQFQSLFPGMEIGSPIRHFEQAFDLDPRSFISASLDASQNAGNVDKRETFHPASERWYLVRSRSLQWVDGRAARLHSLGDISDRIHSERIRQTQQEKLMLTSRLLTAGEMASTLAHEINQPLAAIANYLNGSLRRLRQQPSNDPQELMGAMEKASAQAERAGQIIHRVREFVRTREPNQETLNVDTLLRQVVELSAGATRAPVQLNVSDQLPPISGDHIMLEQVLLNLLRNARDAMQTLHEPRPPIELSARLTSASMIEITVRDYGVGISEEARAQIFSPFYSTKSQGMGMGLNICRSIVESHHGQLSFNNHPDGGAIFTVSLPTLESSNV